MKIQVILFLGRDTSRRGCVVIDKFYIILFKLNFLVIVLYRSSPGLELSNSCREEIGVPNYIYYTLCGPLFSEKIYYDC